MTKINNEISMILSLEYLESNLVMTIVQDIIELEYENMKLKLKNKTK